MKKLIFCILLLFSNLVFSTSNITITGKITNVNEKEVYLVGESFEKIIHLNNDGSFSEVLNIPYDGSYSFYTRNNYTHIYLEKSSKLNINADDTNFANSIKFIGNNALENEYLEQKRNLISKGFEVPEGIFSLDESAYLKTIKEVKNSIFDLFESTKFLNIHFKEYEKRSLFYFEQLFYTIYQRQHAYYLKNEEFKTSDSFPKTDTSIDLDNDADYLFSDDYKELVSSNFYQKISQLAGKNAEYTYTFSLPEIKKIKSNYIKSALLKNTIQELNAGNPDAEILYRELIQLSSDSILKEELTKTYNQIKNLKFGNISPNFNYVNFQGGKTSLESLKGKYVYIDIWATWCEPCLHEFPALEEIQKQYLGKNIEFVSISIDQPEDIEKWRKMIVNKNLKGIQLLADNGWASKFIKDYAVNGIPRFILIDPNGNIVSADAPIPSSHKLNAKFDKIGIK